jgi:hypothetical protein
MPSPQRRSHPLRAAASLAASIGSGQCVPASRERVGVVGIGRELVGTGRQFLSNRLREGLVVMLGWCDTESW